MWELRRVRAVMFDVWELWFMGGAVCGSCCVWEFHCAEVTVCGGCGLLELWYVGAAGCGSYGCAGVAGRESFKVLKLQCVGVLVCGS